jgi:hypothetical protein
MQARKDLRFCTVRWGKAIKEMSDKKTTENVDVPGIYEHC